MAIQTIESTAEYRSKFGTLPNQRTGDIPESVKSLIVQGFDDTDFFLDDLLSNDELSDRSIERSTLMRFCAVAASDSNEDLLAKIDDESVKAYMRLAECLGVIVQSLESETDIFRAGQLRILSALSKYSAKQKVGNGGAS